MGRIGLKKGIYPLHSTEETIGFGQKVASLLPTKSILALSGDLGAGKTTFVQGLAVGLGIVQPIQSPTFILLNLYPKLAHFDLYRLKSSMDFINLGFDEYFGIEGICAIEWPERIIEMLPKGTIYLEFMHEKEGRIAILK